MRYKLDSSQSVGVMTINKRALVKESRKKVPFFNGRSYYAYSVLNDQNIKRPRLPLHAPSKLTYATIYGIMNCFNPLSYGGGGVQFFLPFTQNIFRQPIPENS